MPAHRMLYDAFGGKEKAGGGENAEAEKSMDGDTVALTAADGLRSSAPKYVAAIPADDISMTEISALPALVIITESA